MAVPIWPSTLPQRFERDGYIEEDVDGRIMTEMEAGPPKVRRRAFNARPVSGNMLLTSTQLATMRAFFANDIGGKALPFYFPAHSGTGNWLVLIGRETPRWTEVAKDIWRVSLQLLVMP